MKRLTKRGQNFATNVGHFVLMTPWPNHWRRFLTAFFLALTLITVTSAWASATRIGSYSDSTFNWIPESNNQIKGQVNKHYASSANYEIVDDSILARLSLDENSNNAEKSHCDGKCCLPLIALRVAENECCDLVDLNMIGPVTTQFLWPITVFEFKRPPRLDFVAHLRA